MATLLDTIVAELIVPDSETDRSAEVYEWYLVGFDRTGAQVGWMFYDWEVRTVVECTPVNTDNPDRIRSLITDEQRVVTLVAEDLTRNELEMLQGMAVSKFLSRIYRDDSEAYEAGGHENLAVLSSDYTYSNSSQRYNYTLKVQCRTLPQSR